MNWKESRRDEERLRGRREIGNQAPRQKHKGNNCFSLKFGQEGKRSNSGYQQSLL